MTQNNKQVKEYIPLKGFYDLRAFKIPAKVFNQLWKIQRFLFQVETERRAGKIHPQINEVRNLSGQYQSILFRYPIVNPELI